MKITQASDIAITISGKIGARRIALQLLALCLELCLAACSDGGYNAAIEGVVMDTENNKPIVGAFVIAYWTQYGTDFVGSRTSCRHIEVTKTDEKGRYRIPHVLIFNAFEVDRSLIAYKAGYELLLANKKADRNAINMQPFKGTGDKRIESFRTYGSLREFVHVAQRVEKLGELYRGLDEEVATLGIPQSARNPLHGRSLNYFETLTQELAAWKMAEGEGKRSR